MAYRSLVPSSLKGDKCAISSQLANSHLLLLLGADVKLQSKYVDVTGKRVGRASIFLS